MFRTRGRPSRFLAMIAVAIIALAVPLMPAFAGTNGQQIQLHKEVSAITYSHVYGYNQNDQLVDHPFYVPGPIAYYNMTGWWWKGNVAIYHEDSSQQDLWPSFCTVPVNQGPDYFICASGTS